MMVIKFFMKTFDLTINVKQMIAYIICGKNLYTTFYIITL